MRRLLLAAVMVLGFSGAAFGANFTCTSATACATTPCDWDTAASWTTCNSTYPHNTGGNTYEATITATHVVGLDGSTTNPIVLGEGTTVPLTLNGTLMFRDDRCGAGCTNNFRTLQLVAPTSGNTITIGTAGKLIMRAQHRIMFDSTNQVAIVNVQDGGLFDVQGAVVDTEVEVVTEADADSGGGTADEAKCRVNDTIGRKFTLTLPEGYAAHVTSHDRIVFKSGKMRNRHYEIVSVSGDDIVICSDYEDALSANWECSAASTPYACCTGVDTGTCTVGQRLTGHATIGALSTGAYGRHIIPHIDPNVDICTAANAPFGCCTGSGTGNCPEINPVAGDKLALISDAMFGQYAGTSGYRIGGQAAGDTNALITVAINFADLGQSPTDNSGLSSVAKTAAQAIRDIEYLNIHDYNSSDSISPRGFQNFNIRWNACHDAGASAADASGCIAPVEASSGFAIDGVDVTDNIIYRARGNGLNYNSASETTFATGSEVARNIVFDGCTTASGECGGLEMNGCQNCTFHDNISYDICGTGGAVGNGLKIGGSGGDLSGLGSVGYNNWSVNACQRTYDAAVAGAGTWAPYVTWVNNYGSHSKGYAGRGGRWFSSVLKNSNIGKSELSVLYNPVIAKGLYLLGNDTGLAASTVCTAGDCNRYGLEFDDSTGNQSGVDVVVQDVISVKTDATSGRCLVVQDPVDFDITVSNITCDGRAVSQIGMSVLDVATANTVSVDSFTDYLTMYASQGAYLRCPGGGAVTNFTANSTNSYRMLAIPAADTTATVTLSANCAGTVGTDNTFTDSPYPRRLSGDYNMAPGNTLLTAGTSSGQIGVRAFRFNRDGITSLWDDAITFEGEMPANVSNGTCTGLTACNQDTDSDGVMDIHDNCDGVFNPSQLDTDSDGKGDACDR